MGTSGPPSRNCEFFRSAQASGATGRKGSGRGGTIDWHTRLKTKGRMGGATGGESVLAPSCADNQLKSTKHGRTVGEDGGSNLDVRAAMVQKLFQKQKRRAREDHCPHAIPILLGCKNKGSHSHPLLPHMPRKITTSPKRKAKPKPGFAPTPPLTARDAGAPSGPSPPPMPPEPWSPNHMMVRAILGARDYCRYTASHLRAPARASPLHSACVEGHCPLGSMSRPDLASSSSLCLCVFVPCVTVMRACMYARAPLSLCVWHCLQHALCLRHTHVCVRVCLCLTQNLWRRVRLRLVEYAHKMASERMREMFKVCACV